MIIEDDADILEIMTYILTQHAFSVVSSGKSDILDEVDENYPDLILLDNRLPEGLGLEIGKRYKQRWKTEGKSVCPLIVISADQGLHLLAQSHDADGFIEKPFDVDHFLATIRKFVNNR